MTSTPTRMAMLSRFRAKTASSYPGPAMTSANFARPPKPSAASRRGRDEALRELSAMKRHHATGTGGGRLRAAIFGINDGLVTNASLVVGVAAAEPGRQVVLLAGIAGLVAGAFSMAAGEFISMS